MRIKHFNISVGSQLFKALSEDSRIRLLNLLHYRGPLATSDLELILDFTQAKTNRHLMYLKSTGIISSQRVDQWVLYDSNDEFDDVITQLLKFFEKDVTLKKDLETCDILSSNRELSTSKIKVRRNFRENL